MIFHRTGFFLTIMEHVLKTTYFVATFWDALASTWLPGYPRPGSKVGFSNASRVKARRKDTKGPSGPPPWSMMRQRDWKKAFILYTYIYMCKRTVSYQMTSFCYKFGKNKTLHVISINTSIDTESRWFWGSSPLREQIHHLQALPWWLHQTLWATANEWLSLRFSKWNLKNSSFRILRQSQKSYKSWSQGFKDPLLIFPNT